MQIILEKLEAEFDMKQDKKPSSFLGMELLIDKSEIQLKQETRYKHHKCVGEISNASFHPIKETEKQKKKKPIKFPHREAVGNLLIWQQEFDQR